MNHPILKTFLLAYLLVSPFIYFSQEDQNDNSWKIFPGTDIINEVEDDTTLLILNDSTRNDSSNLNPSYIIDSTLRLSSLEKTNKKGESTIHANDRIKKLTAKMGKPCSNCPTVKIKGYRVQVLNNTKKTSIDEARAKLLAIDTKISTYTDYKAPYFRLRAGNFRSRMDAEKFKDLIKDVFHGAVVIHDKIELPKLEVSN